jgi:DNA-binding XRE family transcriptional regulator
MERGRKENSVAKPRIFCYETRMPEKTLLSERDLARLAKRFRKQAGKSRAQAARDMHVAQVSIFRAEEDPKESLLKLRRRMIEAYSPFKVVGAVFYLERK